MDGLKPAKTQARIERESREKMIVDDFKTQLAVPGAMREAVTAAIATKYHIGKVTVWSMRKRVEQRAETETV